MAVNPLLTPPSMVYAPVGVTVNGATYSWSPGPMIEAFAERLSAAGITTQAQLDAKVSGTFSVVEIQILLKAFARGFTVE